MDITHKAKPEMVKCADGAWVKIDDALNLLAMSSLTSLTMLSKLAKELARAREEIDTVLQSSPRVLN